MGKFVWHALMTTDVASSRRFYTELFGWNVEEVDMGPMGKYTLLKTEGKTVGGLMPMDAKHGAPTHWMSYVSVDNCDAAVKRATSNGGKVVVPAMDIPNVGRFAIIADPQGGHISPFQPNPSSNDGAPPVGTPGAFSWDELHSPDPDAATKFYKELFGWGMKVDGEKEFAYYHFMDGTEARGGMIKRMAQEPVTYWLSYINAADVDQSTERAKKLGAQVYMPPMDVEDVGRMSVLADNAGATFALFKASRK